ncbi:MAG: hypothetical protein V8R40_11190 [Dysosmobacter sp.]
MLAFFSVHLKQLREAKKLTQTQVARALYGGGLYLMGGTVQNSKVYANIGDFAGADLYGDGTVSIVADDYLSLFGDILSENGNDSVAWYSDYEESRYSTEAPTEIIEDTQTLNNPANPLRLHDHFADIQLCGLLHIVSDQNSCHVGFIGFKAGTNRNEVIFHQLRFHAVIGYIDKKTH